MAENDYGDIAEYNAGEINWLDVFRIYRKYTPPYPINEAEKRLVRLNEISATPFSEMAQEVLDDFGKQSALEMDRRFLHGEKQ